MPTWMQDSLSWTFSFLSCIPQIPRISFTLERWDESLSSVVLDHWASPDTTIYFYFFINLPWKSYWSRFSDFWHHSTCLKEDLIVHAGNIYTFYVDLLFLCLWIILMHQRFLPIQIRPGIILNLNGHFLYLNLKRYWTKVLYIIVQVDGNKYLYWDANSPGCIKELSKESKHK